MTPYQIINLSTKYPFDKELSSRLEKIAYKGSLARLVETRVNRSDGNVGIDIIFVSESDIKEYAEEEGIDFLGVHIPYHPEYHREVILICPERILEAADKFSTKQKIKIPALEIYSALLLKVVLHELGHALMAIEKDRFDNRISWRNAWDESNQMPSTKADLYQLADGKVIEESLATAFCLIYFDETERAFLCDFVSDQPKEYRLGLNWNMTPSELLETIDNWRKCKETNTEEISEIYKLLNHKYDGPLKKITNRLENDGINKMVIFSNELKEYHSEERSRWLKIIKSNSDSKEMLERIENGSLRGIYKFSNGDNGLERYDGLFDMTGLAIKSHILGLLKLSGIIACWHERDDVRNILNKHIGTKNKNMLECQHELIKAGLKDFAQL